MNITKLLALAAIITLSACDKNSDAPDDNSEPQLSFQFQFDENQERLDGFGNPVAVADGSAAQSPEFNSMSVHYIELVPNQFTMVEDGAIVYTGVTQAAASGSSFEKTIIWDEALVAGADEVFLELDLSVLPQALMNICAPASLSKTLM